MTVSLIGGHFTENGIAQNYPSRVCLSIAGNGLDEQHADTIVVYRNVTVYKDGPPDLHTHELRRAMEYAQHWYNQLRPIWIENKDRVDYFTITNEIGGSDPEHIKDHIAFESNICELAHADGLKCAVGKLSGDSPRWHTNLWQQYYAPFIVEMWNKYGAVYARHVYGGDLMRDGQPTDDAPGNPQRPFLEVEHLRTLNYTGGIVIAECGLDGGYGLADAQRFEAQALEYAEALKAHSDMIIGLCWWECGYTGWEADYTNHLKDLLPRLDTSLPKWTGGEPVSKPKIVIVKKPQIHDMTAAENEIVSKWAFENYGRTTTHSHDDMLTMLSIGNDESYAGVWWADRQPEVVQMLIDAGYDYVLMPDEPETPYIDVIAYDQCDSRWSGDVLGTGTKTMCQWGCLLVAYTMLADHWGISNGRTPNLENDYYTQRGGFSGHNLVSMAMSKVYDNVKDEGWIAGGNTMHTKTKDYLSRGIPVPARVDFNPATPQWEQHWILLIGWDEEKQDYLMNNPWGGTKAVYVQDHYYNGGILECIYYYLDNSTPPPPVGETVDVHDYFVPSGQHGIYLVMKTGNSTQPMQIEKRSNDVILRKGDGNWIDGVRYQDSEQWRVTSDSVQKGIDTSDQANNGRDAYDLDWAQWIPRHVEIGKTYHSTPAVRRFDRTNCQTISTIQADDYLYIKEIIETWVSPANSNIVLPDVLVIEWRSGTSDLNQPPNETYYFCKNFGYVGWGDHFVSELPQGRQPLSGGLDCGQ